MSILIKGEAIPKDCGDCPLCTFTADEKRYIGYCNTSDDDYYCKPLDRFMEYDEDGGGVAILGKPDDCPLVEVPEPHGRLVDADFMKELGAKCIAKRCDDGVLLALGRIDDLPTVIEAEE